MNVETGLADHVIWHFSNVNSKVCFEGPRQVLLDDSHGETADIEHQGMCLKLPQDQYQWWSTLNGAYVSD